MNNRDVKRKNYIKYKHAGICGCVSCQMARNTTAPPAVKCDYFNPEEYPDEDGWF